MEWVKCSDRMPISSKENINGFHYVLVIVTDGSHVGTCECHCGLLPAPWVEFYPYGDIHPDKITHWMPLPEPPTE